MNQAPVMPNGDQLFRIKEAAEFLRMSDKTVRRMIVAGQLQSKKIRGLRLIKWSDLQKVVQEGTTSRLSPDLSPKTLTA